MVHDKVTDATNLIINHQNFYHTTIKCTPKMSKV